MAFLGICCSPQRHTFVSLCKGGINMGVTTIRSLAREIGVTYWQIRHIIRAGYVSVKRFHKHRKLYLTPGEVSAIKAFFGVSDASGDRNCR